MDFQIKDGEVPLWTDVYCEKRNRLFAYLKKKIILYADIFGNRSTE